MKIGIVAVKGGSGSGNWGHAGRPGLVGGSGGGAGGYSTTTVNSALKFVQKLTLVGGKWEGLMLSDEDRAFLKQTVTKDTYKLYRGMYLMKFRVDPGYYDKLNTLKKGDPIPDYLMKSTNPYVSYTEKVGVAREYSREGHLGIVMEGKVPASDIIVDTQNLESLLKGVQQSVFDEYDFAYFRSEREVLVQEPIGGMVVRSVYGRLSK